MFRRKRKASDFSDEIQSHIQLEAERLREQGLSEEDARAAARRTFGNVTQAQERFYESRRWLWWDYLRQDIRFGLRMLRKSPGFTAVAVLTLALGIGANTAIFSLIDSVMLRMLPVQRPEELMVINIANTASSSDRVSDPTSYSSLSNPLWEQIRDRQDVFSGVFAWSRTNFDLVQSGETHDAYGIYVSGDYFNTLGVRPAAGRLITTSDDVRGCAGAAVLSYGFWQDHFGGAPSAIGSMLNLSNHTIQVIGVAASGFFGVDVGKNFDVALPLCAEAIINGKNSELDRRDDWWLRTMGRLEPGVTPAQASARLRMLSPPIFSAVIPPNEKLADKQEFVKNTLVAMLGSRGLSRFRLRYFQPLEILMFVVGMVLLIACANIASLMLARGAARRKEICIRLALGASRMRMVRELLTESILLSSTGAVAGLLFARWGYDLMVHFSSTMHDPVFLQASLDGGVLAFTAGMALLTGLFFGAIPALRSTRVSLAHALKGGESKDSEGRPPAQPGQWIVVSQIALSLVLVVVAGLFLRSLRNVLSLDPGFDPKNVLVVSANSSNANLETEERVVINQEILESLKSLPGAISASESGVTPVSGSHWQDHFRLKTNLGSASKEFIAAENPVSPEYFATLHSPIRAGRNFDARDTAGAPRVCIINETMARKYFPESAPIGQYLLIRGDTNFKTPPIQIIGILKDAKYESLREDTEATVYLPMAQLTGEDRDYANEKPSFEIRTALPPRSLVQAAEAAIIAVNKSVSLEVHTMEEQVNDSVRQERLLATLAAFFGGLALLLAMIGLYGLLAYMVTQRRKELGIRMALGAQRSSILRLVMSHVAVLSIIGIAAGIGVSLWATRLMQTMLFGLHPYDAKTIILSAVVLVGCAVIAGYLPARRATLIDPMLTLREE